MSLPKPLQAIVDSHREQPLGAMLSAIGVGVAATFASETMLRMSLDNDMRMPAPLIVTSGVLFVLWWLLFVATIASSLLKISTSRITLVAAVWYLESMVQLGVTANVSRSTIVVVLIMSAFAFMGYIIAAYQLQAKITGIRQERKMAAFVAPKVSVTAVPVVEELHDLVPTRK